MLFGDASFQKRARVGSGRCVALEEDEVAGLIAMPAVEEVIVTNFGERGERCVSRDVAADPGVVLVGPDHHGHGVPAVEALDAPLDFAVTRIGNFFLHRNGVDVGRGQLVRRLDAV